jgi:hypothetical protein
MESVARYFTSPAGGVTGGNRPAPPPSRRFHRALVSLSDLSLTYPPDPKVGQAGEIFVLGSLPFVFLSEIRRDDSRAEICEPPMRAREVGPRSRLAAARLPVSLTYPPGPQVSQAGEIVVLGSCPFVFLSEIRRDDSRADSASRRAREPRTNCCFVFGLETLSLTYPPDPQVGQAGETFPVGGSPPKFVWEIRRDNSRASHPPNKDARTTFLQGKQDFFPDSHRLLQPVETHGPPSSRASKTRPPSAHHPSSLPPGQARTVP